MLSTATSSIEKRRQQHRRQNSTPAIFEATKSPALSTTQRNHGHKRGMSLNNNKMTIPSRFQDQFTTQGPIQEDLSGQSAIIVSNTNIGQPTLQHSVQVAQQQSHAQPGQCPTTPPQTHLQLPQTPGNGPTEQQIKELEQHIKSVYGAYGTVFVNILPTPVPTPQKPRSAAKSETVDLAPMPISFGDLGEFSLDPSTSDFDFQIPMERSDSEGYESSYYSSDSYSQGRSRSTSPVQRGAARYGKQELTSIQPTIQEEPAFVTSPQDFDEFDEMFPAESSNRSRRDASVSDVADAVIEETGISAEEVQAYISDQDPVTHRWNCLFPGCDKNFGRRENIRSHIQTHLGDRQFRCSHCGKCFVRQHDLKRHSKIHTGDKPYKCQCGGGFARQDALTRHRQRGMCIGGFPNAMRNQARRGRPKKNRPDFDERMDKSNRTRRALVSSASSCSSGMSPVSDAFSPMENFDKFDMSQFTDLQSIHSDSETSNAPFGFQSASMSFDSQALQQTSSFDISSNPLDLTAVTEHLFNVTREHFNSQTPPMSPVDKPAPYDSQVILMHQQDNHVPAHQAPRSTSNPFTTPPSSPPPSSLFLEGDMCLPRSPYDEVINSTVPPSDLSLFCDTLLAGSDPTVDLVDDDLGASMAWINEF